MLGDELTNSGHHSFDLEVDRQQLQAVAHNRLQLARIERAMIALGSGESFRLCISGLAGLSHVLRQFHHSGTPARRLIPAKR